MIRTNMKYLAWAGAAAVAALLAGCSKDDEIVDVSDQNQRAYIASRFSPNSEINYKGTLDASNLYIADKKLELGADVTANNGYLDQNFDIFLRTTYKAETPVSGTLAVAADAEELVRSYNSSHQSDYKLLDPSYYTILPDRATVEAGQKECTTPFNVVLKGNNDWLGGNSFILPLSCTLDSGTTVPMSESANIVYLKVSVTGEKTTYTDVLLVGKSEYSAATGSAATGSNAVDENNETAWTNANEDEYIEVDFGGGIYLSRVCLVGVDSPMYVYLQTVEDEDFPLAETNFGTSYNTHIYAYNPRSNSGAPMDPYVRVKKVRLQFAEGTGHSLDDVYFLKVDESTIHPQASFGINGNATTAQYSVAQQFSFNGNALTFGESRTGETELDIRAKLDYAINSPLTASCSVASDAEVQAYNSAHSTSYELLPETYYQITGQELNIAAGQRQSASSVHVTLDREKLDNLGSTQHWLLPLTCTADAGGADVTVNEASTTIYIQVDIAASGSSLEQKTPSDYWLEEGTAYISSMSIEKAFDSNRTTIFLSGFNEATVIAASFDEAIDVAEVVLVNTRFYSSSYSYYFPYYVSFSFQYDDDSYSDWTEWYEPDTSQDYVRLDVSDQHNGRKVKTVYTQINYEGSYYYYGAADIYFYVKK